ncbi:MAG TPA: hypothetical protein VL442_13670 [Mucilaginibacter sp.]|jgi:hypothetical protein|nr:hypothetical protein [Mucilaginibacter sp.]
MKMLIVLGLREDDTRITNLFNEAGISMYSRFETSGSVAGVDTELADEWFAASGGKAASIAYFSFADDTSATAALKLVKEANAEHKTLNRLHGFTLPVEDCF